MPKTELKVGLVQLSKWEIQVLKGHAASQALAYMGHYSTTGLKRQEVDTMNKWKDLSDKLAGQEPTKPLPYRGYRGNGFNPEAD